MNSENINRRPLKTRQTQWAKVLSRWLIERKVEPNHISILGIVFACMGGIIFISIPLQKSLFFKGIFYIVAALCIQLRLLCNMLDGMVAVEGNQKSHLGNLYNELPDRLEDTIILVSAGYSIADHTLAYLGWMAALLAVLTAYIRAFGGSLGTKQYFCGPMAKPHRMAVMTVGCLLASFMIWLNKNNEVILLSLILVIMGGMMTCFRRIRLIVEELKTR